jgi:hypothetical protein
MNVILTQFPFEKLQIQIFFVPQRYCREWSACFRLVPDLSARSGTRVGNPGQLAPTVHVWSSSPVNFFADFM